MKQVIKWVFSCLVMSSAAVATAQAVEITRPYQLTLREGPGTHYMAGTKITPHTSFQVGVCNSVWCHIRVGQDEGWIETERLAPDFAKTIKRDGINSAASAGNSNNSTARRKVASTTMAIRMRIISKEEAARRSARPKSALEQQW